MKRHAALQPWSREHHQALSLVQRLLRTSAPLDAAARAELAQTFNGDLLPHFSAEEETLLPALAEAGCHEAVARTLEEHRAMTRLMRELVAGAPIEVAHTFATLLRGHVRFEEGTLFPLAEERLTSPQLAALLKDRSAPAISHRPSTTATGRTR